MPSLSPLIYVRQGISAGTSANAAYRAMQADARRLTDESGVRWTGTNRATFLSLWGNTLAARAKVPNALDWQTDILPDASVMTDHESARSRGYITWLLVHTRGIGESNAESQVFAVHSRQPITPDEAIEQARTGFQTNAQTSHGTLQGRVFVGATYSGTWRMIPPRQ